MKKTAVLVFIIFLAPGFTHAQPLDPARWSFKTEYTGDDEINLVFSASIEKGWHMYGLNMPEDGPYPVSFNFNDSDNFRLLGKPYAVIKPVVIYDDILQMKLETLEGKAEFVQRVKRLNKKEFIISGYVEYMACNDNTCTPPIDAEFSLPVKKQSTLMEGKISEADASENLSGVPALSDTSDTLNKIGSQIKTAEKENSQTGLYISKGPAGRTLWSTILLSILGGLGALLTPCVYPMIPLTVSFFMRGKKSRTKGITEAFVFGISITLIYTLLGVIVAIFKDPNAVNTVSTNWILNLIFFIVFIVLAASFFGMFELVIPGNIGNKIDQQADRGGVAGAFFMALGMTILSFSCTGPIVASLLIKASEGEVLEPVLGMFGFGLVFAVPFTLFAIFPSWLKGLPKSGGWLNSVKVFMAFVMLAFSLYFLNKIDQVYHLNLLTRELYIGIWIVIFTLLGFYLLGKIHFVHDNEIQTVGVPRFFLAIIVFSFVAYLIPGLFGAELRGISSLLPLKEKQQFDLTMLKAGTGSEKSGVICGTPKYADFLNLPLNLQGYFDYKEALTCAKERNKPVLLDFAGHACANCKKMYEYVWSDPRVLDLISKSFVIAALYTDDRTKLPEGEWYTSDVDHRLKNTIGKQNVDLEIGKFNSNALPLYAIVDPDGKILTENPYYVYDPSVPKFIAFLNEGLHNFISER